MAVEEAAVLGGVAAPGTLRAVKMVTRRKPAVPINQRLAAVLQSQRPATIVIVVARRKCQLWKKRALG